MYMKASRSCCREAPMCTVTSVNSRIDVAPSILRSVNWTEGGTSHVPLPLMCSTAFPKYNPYGSEEGDQAAAKFSASSRDLTMDRLYCCKKRSLSVLTANRARFGRRRTPEHGLNPHADEMNFVVRRECSRCRTHDECAMNNCGTESSLIVKIFIRSPCLNLTSHWQVV